MAIAFTNQGVTSGAPVTTQTLGWTPAAGECLVVTSSCRTTGISAVSGCGATWVHVLQEAPSAHTLDAWVGYNCNGSTNTLTFTGAGGNVGLLTAGFSGVLSTASPLDQSTGTAATTSTTIATGSITPSQAGCLVIGCGDMANAITVGAPTNSYNALTFAKSSGPSVATAYIIQGAAASTSTGWTLSLSNNWGAEIFSLKPAVAAYIPHTNPMYQIMGR